MCYCDSESLKVRLSRKFLNFKKFRLPIHMASLPVTLETSVHLVPLSSHLKHEHFHHEARALIKENVPLPFQPGTEEEPIKVCGIQLLWHSEKFIFWFLSCSAVFTYLGYTILQEGVFQAHDSAVGFRFGSMVTLITNLMYVVLAFLDRLANNELRQVSIPHSEVPNVKLNENVSNRISAKLNILGDRVPFKNYMILATMIGGGMYLTNSSLSYINYTTRIVAKCSRVIPTMFVGTLMQGRRYGRTDYFAALILVFGICLFVLGDAASLPQFQPRGVLMVLCALCIEATAGNFEEIKFFNVSPPASHAEVMAYTYSFSSLFTIFGMTFNGEIWPILLYIHTRPGILLRTLLAAVFGYLSLTIMLISIRLYGATNTEFIKVLRKMFSIALSMSFYRKSFGIFELVGIVFTTSGIFLLYALKKKRYMKVDGSAETFRLNQV